MTPLKNGEAGCSERTHLPCLGAIEMNFRDLPLPDLREDKISKEQIANFVASINNFKPFETARLIVRPFQVDDISAIYQIYGPSEIHKWNYLFKKGFSLQDAEKYLQGRLDDQKRASGIGLIFQDKETKAVLGEVHADMDPVLLIGDIGYATCYGAVTQGKGYATEVTIAFLKILCDMGLRHIVLTAAPENLPSHKVISKLCIPQINNTVLKVTDADGDIHPRYLYYLSSSEWLAMGIHEKTSP